MATRKGMVLLPSSRKSGSGVCQGSESNFPTEMGFALAKPQARRSARAMRRKRESMSLPDPAPNDHIWTPPLCKSFFASENKKDRLQQYIRPVGAPLALAPMTFARQVPINSTAFSAFVVIGFSRRRSDLFPSACSLRQSWVGISSVSSIHYLLIQIKRAKRSFPIDSLLTTQPSDVARLRPPDTLRP